MHLISCFLPILNTERGGSTSGIGESDSKQSPSPDIFSKREDPSGRFVCSGRLMESGPRETVYRARDEEEGVDVAWTERLLGNSPVKLVQLFNDMTVLERLDHENVLQYITHFTLGPAFVVITEIMPGDTLKAFIQKSRSRCLKLKVTQRICAQLFRALEYLHSLDPPIAHGNVHCDSIYIDSRTGDVKLGDFQLCGDDQRCARRLDYTAPEALTDGCLCAPLGDVWSFGMCALEMVTGQSPYLECGCNEELLRRHIACGKLPEALDRVPQGSYQVFNQQTLIVTDVRELILACLVPQSLRPTMAVVGLHPFLAASVQMDSPRRKKEDRLTLTSIPSWSSLSPGASPLMSWDSSRHPANTWPTFPPPSPVEIGTASARTASFDSEETCILSVESYLSSCCAQSNSSAESAEMHTLDPPPANSSLCSEDPPALLTPAGSWEPSLSGMSSGTTTRSNGHPLSLPPMTDLSPLCCEMGHGVAIHRLVAEELRLQEALRQLERNHLSSRQRRQEQLRKLETELASLQGPHPKPSAAGNRGGRRLSGSSCDPQVAACSVHRGSLSFNHHLLGFTILDAGPQKSMATHSVPSLSRQSSQGY